MSEQQTSQPSCAAKVLVIGCGNLGAALVRAFRAQNFLTAEQVFVCDRNIEKTAKLVEDLGVTVVDDPAQKAAEVDVIILAVKPTNVLEVAGDLVQGFVKVINRPTIVSVAAGVRIQALQQRLGAGLCIVRAMPNMAATVRASVTGMYAPDEDGVEAITQLFQQIGFVVRVANEELLDAITGLSASGQAFVSVAIEAMADGGVREGLSRAQSQEIVAQTLLGTAKLILEQGWHPGQLKDAIASPGGTTIAGLHAIESGGLRGALFSAVRASTERAKELADKK